jgi:hypothetical protein
VSACDTVVTRAGVTPRRGGRTHACHIVRSNCNAHGECIKRRSWCVVRRGLPAWLLKRFPQRWVTEQRPAYLFGRTDLLNPTHIASLHFLPLMRWMDAEHMQLGQVLLFVTMSYITNVNTLLAERVARCCDLAASHEVMARCTGRQMAAQQVLMVWDNDRSAGPGPYGLGMAAAYGETQWLPHMTGPVVFRWEAAGCVVPPEHEDRMRTHQ